MSSKAHRAATQTFDDLKAYFSNTGMAPVSQGFSGSLPTISSGAGAARAKNAFIRFAPVLSVMPQNAVGLPNDNELSPIVCQLVTEDDAIAPAEILPLLLILARANVRIDWYESPAGTAPIDTFIIGSPAASVQP